MTAQDEAPVVGLEGDPLTNKRVRKSFGARSFWGTVVGSYYVGGGLFYKVSFDDGDVDIFSADETARDAKQAGKFKKDDPNSVEDGSYWSDVRLNSLKRKREGVDSSVESVFTVKLWGQRLYATIFTNDKNETFIKEMMKTEDGQDGELKSTGKVRPGDLILAVNDTRVLGMNSIQVSELIRKPKRPITMAFYRPRWNRDAGSEATPQTEQTQAPPPAHLAPPVQEPTPIQPTAPAQPVQRPTQQRQPYHGAHPATQRLYEQVLAENQRRMGYISHIQASQAMPQVQMPTVLYRPTVGYSVVPNPYIQQAVNAAAMRGLQPHVAQPVAPPPQMPVSTGIQWRRTGYEPSERVQAQRTEPQMNAPSHREPPPQLASHSMLSVSSQPHEIHEESRFTVISQDEPDRSESPVRIKDEADTNSHSAHRSPQPTDEPVSASSHAKPRVDVDADLAAIAALAEENPQAARSAMAAKTSQAPEPPAPTMSFLSPNQFSEPIEPSPATNSVSVRQNANELGLNCVYVKVHRRRLYLTLGAQGSFIAVTSFVPDETGGRGEVEESGQVFVGDVLLAVDGVRLRNYSAPVDVARLVNASPRPMVLAFKRASWDVLEGRE